MIIFNKLDNYFVVSADSQTFLGFEMTANFRDTSPLSLISIVELGAVAMATLRAIKRPQIIGFLCFYTMHSLDLFHFFVPTKTHKIMTW